MNEELTSIVKREWGAGKKEDLEYRPVLRSIRWQSARTWSLNDATQPCRWIPWKPSPPVRGITAPAWRFLWQIHTKPLNNCEIAPINLLLLLFFLNPHPRTCLLILERKEGGEREKETETWIGYVSNAPLLGGWSPQHKCVLWLVIKPQPFLV